LFEKHSDESGKEQYLVPYFISGHPGCEVKDMVELSDYLEENGWRPQQVQDFTPTPMTLATDMYYSGYHPNTGKPVHIAGGTDKKAMQRALLQNWSRHPLTVLQAAQLAIGIELSTQRAASCAKHILDDILRCLLKSAPDLVGVIGRACVFLTHRCPPSSPNGRLVWL